MLNDLFTRTSFELRSTFIQFGPDRSAEPATITAAPAVAAAIAQAILFNAEKTDGVQPHFAHVGQLYLVPLLTLDTAA